jgi:hypothetical protein
MPSCAPDLFEQAKRLVSENKKRVANMTGADRQGRIPVDSVQRELERMHAGATPRVLPCKASLLKASWPAKATLSLHVLMLTACRAAGEESRLTARCRCPC